MNEPEKIDPRELSPLALAFVGDSVLELLVRQRLVEHHRLSAGKLNAEKVKYVSARAQFREEQLLEPLFTEDERTQLRRDTAALEARLARIPAERQQEAEAIETRYAKLNDRTFPVAVIFLVPASAVQGGAA